jgi:hypothetical protein
MLSAPRASAWRQVALAPPRVCPQTGSHSQQPWATIGSQMPNLPPSARGSTPLHPDRWKASSSAAITSGEASAPNWASDPRHCAARSKQQRTTGHRRSAKCPHASVASGSDWLDSCPDWWSRGLQSINQVRSEEGQQCTRSWSTSPSTTRRPTWPHCATGLCLGYPKPRVRYRVLDTEGHHRAVNDGVRFRRCSNAATELVRSASTDPVATLENIEVREVVAHA